MSDKVKNPITGKQIVIDGKTYKEIIKQGFKYNKEDDTWDYPEDFQIQDKKKNETKKTKNPINNRMIVIGGKTYKELLKQGLTYDEDQDLWTLPDDFEIPEKKPKKKNKEETKSTKNKEETKSTKNKEEKETFVEYESEEEEEEYYD